MKRPFILALCLVVGILVFLVLGNSAAKMYLRGHATQAWFCPSPDHKFRIVMYRYPRLRDVPESLGFGQGFVQLQEAGTGKVLAQKDAQNLSELNSFKWSSNKVTVYAYAQTKDFAEWDLGK